MICVVFSDTAFSTIPPSFFIAYSSHKRDSFFSQIFRFFQEKNVMHAVVSIGTKNFIATVQIHYQNIVDDSK
jgi:hypothetical protein